MFIDQSRSLLRNGRSFFLIQKTLILPGKISNRQEASEMNISAEEIRRKSEKFREQIIADRRYLHQIPEIGTDLPETSSYI